MTKGLKTLWIYTLLNIKHVSILTTVRSNLSFLYVPVQIQNVDIGKGVHQRLAHTAKGGVIKVAMVGDKGKYASPRALYPPLPEADKLNIVILKLRCSRL